MTDLARLVIDPVARESGGGHSIMVGTVDPTTGQGVDLPIPSIYGSASGGWYIKNGTAPTAWTILGTASGISAATLTGTVLAAGVVTSSLTQVGTLSTLQVTGGVHAQSLTARGTPDAFDSAGGTVLYYNGAGVSGVRAYGNSGGTAGASFAVNINGTDVATVTPSGLTFGTGQNIWPLRTTGTATTGLIGSFGDPTGAIFGLSTPGTVILSANVTTFGVAIPNGTLTMGGAVQSSQLGAGAGQTAPAWKLEYFSSSPTISRLVFGTDNTGWQFAIASAVGATVTNRMTVSDAGVVSAASFTGTLNTAAQPNITSLGTINNLNANGFTAGGSINFSAQMALQGSGLKLLFHSPFIEDWFIGTVGSTNNWSAGSATLQNILTLTNTGGAMLRGTFVVTAASSLATGADGVQMYTGQAASQSLGAGSTVSTLGTGSNLNLIARGDTGTAGSGVIISYYDSTFGAWRAALDVRNASGFSTLNLMPAGGAVVTGADLRVGAQLFIAGQVAINNGGGAHGYTQFFEPDGNAAMHLGGTDDPGNYYSNTTHTFRTRGGGSNIAVMTGSAAQFNVPIYSIGDGAAFTGRASSNGGVVYLAFQTNTAARRGYVGFGAANSNLFINNDEAGPIVFQSNGAVGVATFSTTAIAFGPRIDMGSYLNLNRVNIGSGGIQFYSSAFTAYQLYMAQAGQAGQGVLANVTAPTGSHVNSWALRSIVEPLSGYGWTWETGAATGSYTPGIVMELTSAASSSGSPMLKMWGDITTRRASTTGVVYFGDQAAYVFYDGAKFDFALKPLGNINGITSAADITLSTTATNFKNARGHKLPAQIISTVAPTSSDLADDGTWWVKV